MPDSLLRRAIEALLQAGEVEPGHHACLVGNAEHLAGPADERAFRAANERFVTENAAVAEAYDRLELRRELTIDENLQQRVQLGDVVRQVVKMGERRDRRDAEGPLRAVIRLPGLHQPLGKAPA